jgi:hypothetical protein
MLQAITRHHLYDIDTIIGRTFAYGALTAILAGLYAASVRLFNAMFVTTTGENSELALVLTTLVLATTFTPIKSRLERLAARRFKPDASREADAHAEAGAFSVRDADTTASATAALDPSALDARIEAIARRVAREELREQVQGPRS